YEAKSVSQHLQHVYDTFGPCCPPTSGYHVWDLAHPAMKFSILLQVWRKGDNSGPDIRPALFAASVVSTEIVATASACTFSQLNEQNVDIISGAEKSRVTAFFSLHSGHRIQEQRGWRVSHECINEDGAKSHGNRLATRGGHYQVLAWRR
ncbi:hypothetical protein BaRGS_00014479, partial [Batillaria attramentaria]